MKHMIVIILLCIIFNSCKDNTADSSISIDMNNRIIREALLRYRYPTCNSSYTIYIAFGMVDVPDSLFNSPHRTCKLIAPDRESLNRFENLCSCYQAFNDSILTSGGSLLLFYPVTYLSPTRVQVQFEEWSIAPRTNGNGSYYYLHFQSNAWVVDSAKILFRT